MTETKRVHIIYKTHLDIGFTDLSANVLKSYVEEYIPKAIALAKRANADGVKRFVWSTGAWLVDYYLKETTGAAHNDMVEAIQLGFIDWHGLPFTSHCELMSPTLFEYGLSIGKRLDERFSKQTIAAKMTDVPGHTAGILKYLTANNIQYLHIGINDASPLPNVPSTFVWESPEGKQVLVDYCRGYGQEKTLDVGEDLLYFAHSGDNSGPPSYEEVLSIYTKVCEKYPQAEVFGSGLSAYAKAILPYKNTYPVITQEIGDTWIHGVGVDPLKVGIYKEYLRFYEQIQDELSNNEKEAFLSKMLMVSEHTWGMDLKKYLSDYVNWDKESFKKARTKDVLEDSYAGDYPTVFDFAKHEFLALVKTFKWEERSYSLFESSHQEQRDYLTQAIDGLSPENQQAFLDIKQAYTTLTLKRELPTYEKFPIGEIELEAIGKLTVSKNGVVTYNGHSLGHFSYELYGTEIFERYRKDYSYGLTLDQNYNWAMPDFYKLGFEKAGATKENRSFDGVTSAVYVKENNLIVPITYSNAFCEENGCPREIYVKYTFLANEVIVEVNCLDKDAHRMPESLWLSFFENNSFDDAKVQKLGSMIDPYHVVERGNRNYHAVENVVFDNDKITIIPLHTPLVSLGEKRLYDFHQTYADFHGGAHFNLYNNLWGTNFKMWYEEDMKAVFSIRIEP